MNNDQDEYMPFQRAQTFADDARAFLEPPSGEPSEVDCARALAFAQLATAFALIEIAHRIGDMTNQVCLAVTDPRG